MILNLTSKGYAGAVSFTTSVTSSSGTAADVIATATPVTLTSDGSGSSTLTIATRSGAAKREPTQPWKTGGALMLCSVLGLPFAGRRKQVLAVLLTALAITMAGFSMACSGGSYATNGRPNLHHHGDSDRNRPGDEPSASDRHYDCSVRLNLSGLAMPWGMAFLADECFLRHSQRSLLAPTLLFFSAMPLQHEENI